MLKNIAKALINFFLTGRSRRHQHALDSPHSQLGRSAEQVRAAAVQSVGAGSAFAADQRLKPGGESLEIMKR